MIVRWIIVGVITAAIAVFTYLNFDQLKQSNQFNVALRHAAVSPAVLEQALNKAEASPQAVFALWQTQGIPHRQAVIHFLRQRALSNPQMTEAARIIVREALRDPDIDVQQDALQAASSLDPDVARDLLPIMLNDPDPKVRLMWLKYLAVEQDPQYTSRLIERIQDDDPQVQTLTLQTLGRWTGRDFGALTDRSLIGDEPAEIDPATRDAAIQSIRRWWAEHHNEYPPALPSIAPPSGVTLPAYDFQLGNTQGKSVRLSDFIGRPVLLHFWTTSDRTCQRMAGELIKLQYRLGDELTIMSVALDGVGADGVARYRANEDGSLPFNESMRVVIQAAAQAQQLNFPVLIEDSGLVAGAYEGFNVPVTVWIDAEGRIRRRLAGHRSMESLIAMFETMGTPAEPRPVAFE